MSSPNGKRGGCAPEERALKSLFLGPQAENAPWLEGQWQKMLLHWIDWRRSRFPGDGRAISAEDQASPLFLKRWEDTERNLDELLSALDRESPRFTPRYLGHMTSEIALPALLGHVAALLHNPNQTSRDVSQAASQVENEAISDLLSLIRFPAGGRGHFTSGGTLANLEFLWRAVYRLDRTLSLALVLRERGLLGPGPFERLPCFSWDWMERMRADTIVSEEDLSRHSLLRLGQAGFAREYRRVTGQEYSAPVVLAPASRHYSWPKVMALAGLGTESLWDIPLDTEGRLSIDSLQDALDKARKEGRGVMACVSVAGATGTGAVDPVHRVQDLLEAREEATWHHVDAAYGGYFCALLGTPHERSLEAGTRSALQALARARSVTLDPHKLGFVPYACGAFLARDELHYRSPSFAAPYLKADHEGPWMHTLEGSRAATGAAACWMANRSIGFGEKGYGMVLRFGREAALALAGRLGEEAENYLLVGPADLNIVCFSLARKGELLSGANERTEACFAAFRRSPGFALSKTELSCDTMRELVARSLKARQVAVDAPTLVCLRVVLMNPFLTTRETVVRYLSAFLEELRSTVKALG